MFQVDWKKVPRGTTIAEIFLIGTVLLKVALNPLDYASAAIMLPIAIIYITKVLIGDERERTKKRVDDFERQLASAILSISKLQTGQAEVFKQSEETKSIISKLNLASAFGGRKRGE